MKWRQTLLSNYLRSRGNGKVLVVALAAGYIRFARIYYRKNGRPTNELYTIRRALKVVLELYGAEPAEKFGPKALKAVRDRMIEKRWCRNQINKQIHRVRRCFKWAVSEELIPGSVHESLRAVTGLRMGRSKARETLLVTPVDPKAVDATLHFVRPTIADMVRLQGLTGMRPGEVCALRPMEITFDETIWVYRPASHKSEHHGRDRIVLIGPKAQKILAPYLNRLANTFCFSPAESRKQWQAEKSAKRKTPLSCGNRPGTNCKADPKRKPRDCYDVWSYGQAISRAAKTAGVEHWSPHQLRHRFATDVRKTHGLEAVQVALGHVKADVTQIYAERDLALAIRVAREVG